MRSLLAVPKRFERPEAMRIASMVSGGFIKMIILDVQGNIEGKFHFEHDKTLRKYSQFYSINKDIQYIMGVFKRLFLKEVPMSSDSNPYQSPQTEIDSVKSLAPQGVLTDPRVFYLKESSPWLRFIGILGYITSGITAMFGFVISITTLTMGNIGALLEISDFTGALGRFAGLIYIIAGVIMFFPARFTYNFGARIRNFVKNNSEQELELAFKNNKSLWKFMGINAIIGLAFIPVIIVITLIILAANLFSGG
jgi:hypothetical protein